MVVSMFDQRTPRNSACGLRQHKHKVFINIKENQTSLVVKNFCKEMLKIKLEEIRRFNAAFNDLVLWSWGPSYHDCQTSKRSRVNNWSTDPSSLFRFSVQLWLQSIPGTGKGDNSDHMTDKHTGRNRKGEYNEPKRGFTETHACLHANASLQIHTQTLLHAITI